MPRITIEERIERLVMVEAQNCLTCHNCKTAVPGRWLRAECALELWPVRYRTLDEAGKHCDDCAQWAGLTEIVGHMDALEGA